MLDLIRGVPIVEQVAEEAPKAREADRERERSERQQDDECMRQHEHHKAEYMKQRIDLQTQQRTQGGGQVAVGSGVSSASHADGSSQQQQATPAAGGDGDSGQSPGTIFASHAQPSGVPPASLSASGLAQADEGMSCAVMEIAGYDGERGVFGQTTVFAFSSRPARALFLANVCASSSRGLQKRPQHREGMGKQMITSTRPRDDHGSDGAFSGSGDKHKCQCQERDYTRRWNSKFELLKAFMQEHQHDHVPRSNVGNRYESLASWVVRQRYEYQHQILKQERLRRLASIGFHWTLAEAKAQKARVESVDGDCCRQLSRGGPRRMGLEAETRVLQEKEERTLAQTRPKSQNSNHRLLRQPVNRKVSNCKRERRHSGRKRKCESVDDCLYLVEAVLGERSRMIGRNPEREVLVLWKGFGIGSATWEPVQNIPCQFVDAFEDGFLPDPAVFDDDFIHVPQEDLRFQWSAIVALKAGSEAYLAGLLREDSAHDKSIKDEGVGFLF